MAKSLNQNLFSNVVFGGEGAGDILRLESTTSGSKGAVQLVASSVDLILGTQIGKFVHFNTATRTYTLPDVSGTVVVGGIFTAANQLLYSTAANALSVVTALPASALVANASGNISWASGVEGNLLQIIGGSPTFAPIPANIGTIAQGFGNSLPLYQAPGPGNSLTSLPTLSTRALLSSVLGVPTWSLITGAYLAAAGNIPLGSGLAGQKLKAVGDGTFVWADDNANVLPGVQFKVPFYSNASGAQVLDDSVFLEVNELNSTLTLLNHGKVRLHVATASGTQYVELRAPISMAAPLTLILPAADGPNGAFLTTNGAGTLQFTAVDNGVVNFGVANQIAYYATTTNRVSGLTTASNRVLTSPSGVLTWTLITTAYLSALNGDPLGNGALNQVLVSNSNGTFNWATASDLVGSVSSGGATAAAYYAVAGTTISSSSFVAFAEGIRAFQLKNNGALHLLESTANGVNFVALKAPTSLTVDTTYTLPGADGIAGQALLTNGTGTWYWDTVGSGSVTAGNAGELAFYQASGSSITSYPNIASKVLITLANNTLAWSLINEGYLATTGGQALSGGFIGQVLISDGSGNFLWTDASSLVGRVEQGVGGYLSYYPVSGTTVDDTPFLFVDTTNKVLNFQNNATLRLHTALSYTELKASASTSNITYTLPLLPLASGHVLTSNTSGDLYFESQVEPGLTSALSFYNSTARKVSPIPNVIYDNSTPAIIFENVEIKGAYKSIALNPTETPTPIIIKGGEGLGYVGADVKIYGGNSDVTTGSVLLGSGGVDSVSVDASFLTIFDGKALKFIDTGIGYVGFKSPTSVTSDTIWSLPSADGTLGQVLKTDGLGNLDWVTVAANAVTVNAGNINTLAYYSSASSIDSSSLLLPIGLPSTNLDAMVVTLAGQIQYATLVETGGVLGNIPIYKSIQTVGTTSLLNLDTTLKELQVESDLVLKNATNALKLKVPAVLTNYELELPGAVPLSGQEFIVDATASKLNFAYGDAVALRQQRGFALIPSGVTTITVVYTNKFSALPETILTQWSHESTVGLAELPQTAIKKSTKEGFVLKLSSPLLNSGHKLYWESYLQGGNASSTIAYLSGGEVTGTCYLLQYDMNADVLTPSLTVASKFAATGASNTIGYILGGKNYLNSEITSINSLIFSTNAVSTLSTTIAARSRAAGLSSTEACYILGGETATVANLGVEKFSFVTETLGALGALATASVSRAHTQVESVGLIINNDLSVYKLTFSTDSIIGGTFTGGGGSFEYSGTALAGIPQVGCTNSADNLGFFGTASGSLFQYDFTTDTSTLLANSLTSNTGLSSSFNSFTHGFFSGTTIIEKLDFSTLTVANTGQVLPEATAATALQTFHTNGML